MYKIIIFSGELFGMVGLGTLVALFNSMILGGFIPFRISDML
jgi:hypothetical protein